MTKEQFIEEARKRGIVPGAIINSALTGARVKTKVSDTSNWWKSPNSNNWNNGETADTHCYYIFFNGKWATVITPAPIDDDIIRVGDTVERISSEHMGMVIGDRAIVTKVRHDGAIRMDSFCPETYTWHNQENFRKVKTGAQPSLGNKTTNHGQVSGSFEGQGEQCGAGEAVRSDQRKGRIAVGSYPAGNPLKARTGKGRLGDGQVSFAALSAAYL